MATSSELQEKFLNWNLNGSGRDRGATGNWRFIKSVLYYQNSPQTRFVTDADGNKISFRIQSTESLAPSMPNRVDTNRYNRTPHAYWYVPEIGVYSPHEGDMISEADLHARLKVRFTLDIANELDAFSSWNIEEIEKNLANGNIQKGIDRHYARYTAYTQRFQLRWGSLPSMYRDQIMAALHQRVNEYRSPAKVRARERAKAKKTAKKAFGLS